MAWCFSRVPTFVEKEEKYPQFMVKRNINLCIAMIIEHYHSLGKFSKQEIDYFSYFPQKTDFDISCKVSPKMSKSLFWDK